MTGESQLLAGTFLREFHGTGDPQKKRASGALIYREGALAQLFSLSFALSPFFSVLLLSN